LSGATGSLAKLDDDTARRARAAASFWTIAPNIRIDLSHCDVEPVGMAKRQRIDTMIDFHVHEAQKARKLAAVVKKLSKSERLLDEQMLALIEWASEHPGRWHDIGNLEATKKAAELLEKRGVIEIWRETNQYLLKPAQK
jgi:hypothetical protein